MPSKKKQGNGKLESKSKRKDRFSEHCDEEDERLDLLQKAISITQEIDREKALAEQFKKQSELLKQYWEFEKKAREVSLVRRSTVVGLFELIRKFDAN